MIPDVVGSSPISRPRSAPRLAEAHLYGWMMGASAPIAGSTGPCSRGRAAEAPRITEVLVRVLEAIGRVSDRRPEAALDFVRLNRWLGLIGQADELFRFTHGGRKRDAPISNNLSSGPVADGDLLRPGFWTLGDHQVQHTIP